MLILFLLIPCIQEPTHPIIDSLSYHYSLNQPDTLVMTAECSLSPDENIEIYYSKLCGIQVKTDGAMGEIVKGLFLLTGIGISNFWKTLGAMDTVMLRDDILTLVPEEKTLFSEAELKIDRQKWLVTSARVKLPAEGDPTSGENAVFAKIYYNNRLPTEITVKGSSDFTIKQKYGKGKTCTIPVESIVTFDANLPDIDVKYTLR